MGGQTGLQPIGRLVFTCKLRYKYAQADPSGRLLKALKRAYFHREVREQEALKVSVSWHINN